MRFVDTHCHIQFDDYGLPPEEVMQSAKADGVVQLMVVGCTLEDSQWAVEYAKKYRDCFASIGLHPHEGAKYANDTSALAAFRKLAKDSHVSAIGECGLDYFYDNAPRDLQKKLLRFQLEIAKTHNLPLIFHVREAFDDFFAILDEFGPVKGVVHCFTADRAILAEVLRRGLYVGLNGIMTFTKDDEQLAMAKAVPLKNMLLETDAPFLTPRPFRGTICEPKHVRVIAAFLGELRGDSLADIAAATTKNAQSLFHLT